MPEPGSDERGPVGWQRPTNHPVIRALEAAGIHGEQLLIAIQELMDAKVLVSTGYYIPTFAKLDDDYHALGVAYLTGRIKVRWVMCAETHEALKRRYTRTNFIVPSEVTAAFSSLQVLPSPDVLELTVRTMMERGRHWDDPGSLFGIPIRLDPVARRPVFEILDEESRRG